MKVFRDIFAAVMVGIMGGLLVSTVSYYNHHKEGGAAQTLLAVANSFDTVARAYSSVDEDKLLAGNEDYTMDDKVLEAFEKIEEGEADSVTEAVFGTIFSGNETEGDILAMDGEDGNIDEGTPYSGIMRFHVRANSDSDEDQALKMAVKEDVITMLKPLLSDCENVAESKNIIVSNLQNIYTTAVNTITEQGYDYTVKVYVTEEEFPAKTYGDLTFPAGEYQALRIDIGEAKGQNWWCVMYPPLCFIDESTTVVSEEGKEILKENLTPEEYADLFAHSEVKGESWLYNWITGK
ncbi:MAG: stage II sporulation protein R, partial [Lachnospiraceae bacterium]